MNNPQGGLEDNYMQHMLRNIVVFLTIFVFCEASTRVASAQTSRGSVTGTVTDPNGAVIVAATVTLTNVGTSVGRATTTNEEGLYRFDAVDLGTYNVSFATAGFGNLEKTNVVVSANQSAVVDAQLQLGATVVSIDVIEEAGVVLQTEAPVRGGNISEIQITELPISDRNPVALALTLPGVSSNRGGF